MRAELWSLLLVAATSFEFPAVAQQTSQPVDVAREPQMVPGKPYVPIFLEIPVDEITRLRVTQMLSLSDSQSLMLDAFFRESTAANAKLRQEKLPHLYAVSELLGAAGAGVASDSGLAQQHADFIEEAERLRAAISRSHELVFMGLEPALTDDQKAGLPRALSLLKRRAWDVVPKYRSAASVDLSLLVADIVMQRGIIPTDATALDAILADYEHALSHLLEKHSSAKFIARRRVPLLLAEATSAGGEQAKRLQHASTRLHADVDRLEKRIADLNRSYVEFIADFLNADDSAKVRYDYLVIAYPEAWPNPFDLGKIFEVSTGYVYAENREAFAVLQSNWEAQTLDVTAQMTRAVDRWLEIATASRSQKPDARMEFQRDMDEMQAARAELSAKTIDHLKLLLPQPVPVDVQTELRVHYQTVKNRKPRPAGLSYIP